MKVGKVYLVGAGPGDPGLITQKGLECLAQADVIIYDHLLDEGLLDWAPRKAERLYVGKIASAHTREQVEINRLLVEKAKEGKVVVRLKGGDPFVLGRGGEEAEALVHNHIPFEVVSGVSSAVAVPAYAGIPVTHRGLASSFAVVTGHEDPTKTGSSIDWEKLATGVDTLVFLMGTKNLPEIVTKLVKHGRPSDTPVAVIKDGTRPEQKVIAGSLKNIVDRVKKQRLEPPTITVVGEVVRLREKLRWFDNRPLSGKRILVTRSRHQASVLSKLLSEHGAQSVELPTIDIQRTSDTRELAQAISNLARYQWILFTSVNGVESFFEQLHSSRLDSRALHGLKIGAIGPATAKTLEQKGIVADYCPDVYTTEGLIAGLKGRDISGKRFLLPRANIVDQELTKALTQLGAEAHEIAVYKTAPAKGIASRVKEIFSSGQIDVITFTSSSTVANFVAAFGKEDMEITGAKVACIGPKTAETAARAGLKTDIMATEHTIPGLVVAIEKYFGKEI
jgi:uroporphyrinogen III methyltransferase/synthase